MQKAEVAAVVPDVLGDLVEGLGEIDDAAVPVPAVDEIVDDVVLDFVVNQIVEDHEFLVARGQLLERDDVVPARWRLDDLVTDLRVNVFGKVI